MNLKITLFFIQISAVKVHHWFTPDKLWVQEKRSWGAIECKLMSGKKVLSDKISLRLRVRQPTAMEKPDFCAITLSQHFLTTKNCLYFLLKYTFAFFVFTFYIFIILCLAWKIHVELHCLLSLACSLVSSCLKFLS